MVILSKTSLGLIFEGVFAMKGNYNLPIKVGPGASGNRKFAGENNWPSGTSA
jgi:hypothetical protein